VESQLADLRMRLLMLLPAIESMAPMTRSFKYTSIRFHEILLGLFPGPYRGPWEGPHWILVLPGFLALAGPGGAWYFGNAGRA